jgi:hypothetical protein
MKKPTSVVVSHIVTKERTLKEGDYIFVIDCRKTEEGIKADAFTAKVFRINPKQKTISAYVFYECNKLLYKRDRHYSFNDYGRLFFDTEAEALEASQKIPKPKQAVYKKIGNRYYIRIVTRIVGMHCLDTFDLYISLDKGYGLISIKDIGTKLFIEHPKK